MRVASSLLDQLVLLALVKFVAMLIHEAADEVIEALIHHDVLEHCYHGLEGTRRDLATENTAAERVIEVWAGGTILAASKGVRTQSHRRE